MENTTVFAGDSHGAAVPRRQYNYVRRETKKLLDSNRAHLIRTIANATSIQEGETFYDEAREYLLDLFDPEWSEHASGFEKHVLKRLHEEGHEKIAERLNLLIEFLAEDGEKFTRESVFTFAVFVLTNRPQYPGPGIFGDDDGHLGIQWRIPSNSLPSEDNSNSGGILYLEFISPDRVSYFCDADDSEMKVGEARLSEIMEVIKPITRRLDW